MIIKSNPKKNFTCIPNDIFADDRLSRKARFLLLELLSKPASWNLNYKHLVNSGKEGEYSVRGGIEELLETGYIHREITRQNGRISGIEYYVYDRPITRDEHKTVVSVNPVKEMPNITPLDQYPNRQNELPFQAENSSDIGGVSGKNHTLKTSMQKTTPILNTDNNKILRGETTTTTQQVKSQMVEESRASSKTEMLPSSFPAHYVDNNNFNDIINLIPVEYQITTIKKIVSKALIDHTAQEVEEAVKYTAANVRGGVWQFKAYLDKTLQNGWSEGYLESMAVQNTESRAFPFPARCQGGVARYPNGTITGSARMDSNYQAAADFLRVMGVQP